MRRGRLRSMSSMHADGVARRGVRLGGEGVFDGLRDAQPARGVEGDVDRLLDVGLGGDELDLEARRQVELFLLLLGRERRGIDDERKVFGRGEGGNEAEQGEGEEANVRHDGSSGGSGETVIAAIVSDELRISESRRGGTPINRDASMHRVTARGEVQMNFGAGGFCQGGGPDLCA